MSWNTHIYVAVLGGRADVWRPVLAERVGETTYAILEQPYDPDSERWSFEPGDAVECELIQVVPLGSHALYRGRVVCTHVDETLRSGDVELHPIILVSRRYKAANQFLCDFGASAGCPPE